MSLLKRIEQGQAEEKVPALAKDNNKNGGAIQNSSRMSGISARRVAAPSSRSGDVTDLKTRVQNKLLAELDPSMDVSQTVEVRQTIEELFENILADERIVLSRPERRRLFEQIVAEILGLGPIEPLLADSSITEIMVNGAKQIYVERSGKIFREPATFESDDHLMRIIDRIVAPLGRRIDESSPYVDARLPDGSRVNAIIPPISLVGPTLTIRKFARDPITADQLIEWGTVTPEAV
ncbi:MAG: Flp pilus assembly complex ATPase component TadA, partial [Anaerolineales bacterium]|nr:Flp pilus assembly complex ATPase component TadA [Anaerolineales bacterium]